MADVIDLAHFLHKRELASSTYLPELGKTDYHSITETDSEIKRSVGSSIAATRLYGSDENTELGRFFIIAADAISVLEDCAELLRTSQNLAADDRLMASKALFAELYILRDVSEAAGLISLKCLQASCKTKAITDAPELIVAMLHALRLLRNAPFMKFDVASELASKIEEAAGPLNLPGFNELSMALIEESNGD
jgi:hypothetical protein